MSIIYKFPIETEVQTRCSYVILPKNSKVFSLALNGDNEAYIYAIVDSKEKEKERREILWLGTGWGLTTEEENKIKDYIFLGTYKTENNFVWHFWIEPEKIEWNCINFETNEIYKKHCYRI